MTRDSDPLCTVPLTQIHPQPAGAAWSASMGTAWSAAAAASGAAGAAASVRGFLPCGCCCSCWRRLFPAAGAGCWLSPPFALWTAAHGVVLSQPQQLA